jgi:hypothetical protein
MIMKCKGQTLIFEQVLMFSVGVVILITSIALFMMYQNFYLSETSQDQITQVKEYILSQIITLCGSEEHNSSVIIEIPRTIGGFMYRITLSDIGLNITQEPKGPISDFSTLYGLNETFDFFGTAVSDMGRILLFKRDNEIILDRME